MQYGSFRMDGRKKGGGKFRQTEKNGKIVSGLIRFFLPLLLLIVVIIIVLNYCLYPTIVSIAKMKAESTSYKMLSIAINNHIAENPSVYSDFIRINYDSDGNVSSLETNMANLNYVCSSILIKLLEEFEVKDTFCEKVPIGALFGSNLNSGLGPDLTIKITVMRGMAAHIRSSFTEVGINQTLHRIVFVVNINMCAIMPSGEKEFSIESSMCIAETIIVGIVPSAYTKINRLTDDIVENEIDDMYDFGAENS